MKTVLASMLILLLTFGLSINDAAARSFGARGFSSYRSHSAFLNFSRNKQAYRPAMRNPSTGKWRGIFSGMLLGGLLTSLFMGHGFGSAVMSWMVLGILLSLVVGFVRRKQYENAGSDQDSRRR